MRTNCFSRYAQMMNTKSTCPVGEFPIVGWETLNVCILSKVRELPPTTNPLLSQDERASPQQSKQPASEPAQDSDRMPFQLLLEQAGQGIKDRFFGGREDPPALPNKVPPGRVPGHGGSFRGAPR